MYIKAQIDVPWVQKNRLNFASPFDKFFGLKPFASFVPLPFLSKPPTTLPLFLSSLKLGNYRRPPTDNRAFPLLLHDRCVLQPHISSCRKTHAAPSKSPPDASILQAPKPLTRESELPSPQVRSSSSFSVDRHPRAFRAPFFDRNFPSVQAALTPSTFRPRSRPQSHHPSSSAGASFLVSQPEGETSANSPFTEGVSFFLDQGSSLLHRVSTHLYTLRNETGEQVVQHAVWCPSSFGSWGNGDCRLEAWDDFALVISADLVLTLQFDMQRILRGRENGALCKSSGKAWRADEK